MKTALVTSLPVLSLFVGAWLAGRTKKADVRSSMRLEAADLFAEIPVLLWKKGDENDWIKVAAGLDRLRFRLCLAGLRPSVARSLVEGGHTFWSHVRWQENIGPEGEDGWVITTEYTQDWRKASAIVVQWLADNWRLRRWLRLWWQARQLGKPKEPGTLHLGEV